MNPQDVLTTTTLTRFSFLTMRVLKLCAVVKSIVIRQNFILIKGTKSVGTVPKLLYITKNMFEN